MLMDFCNKAWAIRSKPQNRRCVRLFAIGETMGKRTRILRRDVNTVALLLILKSLSLDAAKIIDNGSPEEMAAFYTRRGEDTLRDKFTAVPSSLDGRIADRSDHIYPGHQFESKILQNIDSAEVATVQTKNNSHSHVNEHITELNNRKPQLIRPNIVSSTRNLKNHDLHTAFRLPLQRLSDMQLLVLLQRYHRKLNGALSNVEIFEKMSRAKKIERLQKLIENGSGRLNLIRPTLLTNVNVLDTEEPVSTPKSFPVHRESATVDNVGEKRQKHIPELMDGGRREDSLFITENNSEVIVDLPVNSRELSTLERMLVQAKARYETVKRIFETKLQELHEKKMRMAAKLFSATSTTSLPELQTTTEPLSEITTNDSILGKTNLIGESIAHEESGSIVLSESATTDAIETMSFDHTDTSEIKNSSDDSRLTEAHNPLKYGLQSRLHTIKDSLEVNGAVKAELDETEKTTANAEGSTQTTNWDWEEEELKYSSTTTEANIEEQLPISGSVKSNSSLESLETISPEDRDPPESSTPYNVETDSINALIVEESSVNNDQEKTTTESLSLERTTKIASDIVEDEKQRSITTSVQNNEKLHHPAESEKVGENRLIRKLLGIIQYATKSGKQSATFSTSNVKNEHNSSTTFTKLHDSSAEENNGMANEAKAHQIERNHRISTTESKPNPFSHESTSDAMHIKKLIKHPAPRAQPVPKLLSVASQNNNGSSWNTEEDTPERAEIITANRTHVSDGIRNFTMKISRERYISAAELIGSLEKEWKTRIYGSTSRNDKSRVSVDKHELEEITQTDDEATCNAVACDFEQGDLCQWVASVDELMPGDRQYRYHFRNRRMRRGGMRYNMERRGLVANRVLQRRQTTDVKDKNFVQRTWHNWEGRYRNRLTGIARAQIFSHSNRRFAAAYVKPNQRATLSASLLSGRRETIRFRAWEATRDLRLRVCCDSIDNSEGGICVFETDGGVRRGSRNWKEYTATCPRGTQKIIFECVNTGFFQGACGVDNVHLLNEFCPQIIPLVGLVDNHRI